MDNKIKIIFISLLFLNLTLTMNCSSYSEFEPDYEKKLNDIKDAIEDNNAEWTAGYTSVFGPDKTLDICYLDCIDDKIDESEYIEIEYSGKIQ